MGRLKLNLRSHQWLRLSADTPGKSKIEVAEVHEKSNEDPATADKFCLSPLNDKSFDIAYPSKNGQQGKSRATREAEVVSDVGCRCWRSSSNSHRLRTEEEEKPVRVKKSRAQKNENTKGEGTVDHGNNNSVPSSGSSPMNSRFSSAAANLPALKPPISNGKNSSGSAEGFEPETCGAMYNKNYNINSAARSRENAENETENDLVNCNWWARKCEECACSHDVEGNVGILQGRCCSVHGKACQSFAEVKRSEDPYSDFRCSMVQMILEKNIYQPSELRGLLECFLSLNSPEHHGIIVEAFTKVCVNISCILSEGT